MKKKISVKSKLITGFIILFLILTLIFTWYLTAISNAVYRASQEADLKELVYENLSKINNYENGRLSLDEGFLYEYSGIMVSVYNKDKALLAGQIPVAISESPEFINGTIHDYSAGGPDFLILDMFYPLNWDDGIWVRGIVELTDQSRIIKNLAIASLVTLPLFLVIAGLFSYLITKRALLPLDTVNNAAKSINSGNDLSQRINLTDGSQEFLELSASMDKMLERLEYSFEKEKRFTSDVSHELRTPISVIKAAAEYSLKYDDSKEEFRESMKMIEKNALSMTTITENLLDLARMDKGILVGNFTKINISNLVKNICDEFNYPVETSIYPDIEISGDEVLIKRLLNNLLTNSREYGKENGHIWLSLYEEDDTVILSVKDDGIGISEEKQRHIFDRFFRADESRSSQVSGAGLGLSFVKEIASMHGADIQLDSILDIGTEFKIIFKK